ncbi:MAG TPA: hypothetical protein VFY68_00310 [Nitrososphaeraceae archaeon]|nr:hypothetical protein [Nitrososphaeraceae archaeon]
MLPIQAGIYWGWIHQKVTNAERYFARERCINHRFVASESTYVTPLNWDGSLEDYPLHGEEQSFLTFAFYYLLKCHKVYALNRYPTVETAK